MKKLLSLAAIGFVFMGSCNEGSTNEPTVKDSTTIKTTESNEAAAAQNRAQEISDSTKMQDKNPLIQIQNIRRIV